MSDTSHPNLTVIEASAGTGKTHRIENLVFDSVIRKGVPIERIMAVTYTRAATAELRSRIRSRLRKAATEGDAVARARAAEAVRNLDQAAISTIHGFCGRVLTLAGVGGGRPTVDPAAEGRLIREVINDALVSVSADPNHPRYEIVAGEQHSTIETVTASVVRTLLTHRRAVAIDGAAGTETVWVSFVVGLRDEVDRRRAQRGTVDFDEMVRLAHGAVRDDGNIARVIGDLYDLVLIDEFQDTDRLQWELFTACFLNESSATDVIVVGDPKQAIYGFRGADLGAFLEAKERAGTTDALTENWRASSQLLAAQNLLLSGAQFGDQRIEHVELQVADEANSPAINLPAGPALHVRLLRHDASNKKTNSSYVAADSGRRRAAADAAAMVVEMLASPATAGARPLRASDIAVLARSHKWLDLMAEALAARGIAAARVGGEGLATSSAAEAWRNLLRAMNQPSSSELAVFAATGPFVSWSFQQAADATDDERAALQLQLQGWGQLLRSHGIGMLYQALRSQHGLTERVVCEPDGQRLLTDLEHIAEVLASEFPTGVDPVVLLDALVDLGGGDAGDGERQRRIDTDTDAVQMMTMHACKGLQFPVVLLPFEWSRQAPKPSNHGNVFDHSSHGQACNVELADQSEGEFGELAKVAARGEEQRLLYVALTRAQLRAVVWWGAAYGPGAPLGELLMQRSDDGLNVDPNVASPKSDFDDERQRIDQLVAASYGTIGAIVVAEAATESAVVPAAEPAQRPVLACASVRHRPDTRIRRHSFTSISSADDRGHSASTGEWVQADDEGVAEPDRGTESNPNAALSGALLGLRAAGTDFGTRFHATMEQLDFAADDLDAAIDAALTATWPTATLQRDRAALAAGVEQALMSPTGSCLGGRPLRELAGRDRLNELDFDLPLAGSGGASTQRDIGALLLDHLADDHPFRPYAQQLRTANRPLALIGHMIGSIDLVARVPRGGETAYVISDYKTNRLHRDGDVSPIAAYDPAHLPRAMIEHDYPLQIVLYSVVLHRYLRWRLQGYEPQRHLGGAEYLFVRGMIGAATPCDAQGRPFGVFSWDVPPALTVALSQLLDGAR